MRSDAEGLFVGSFRNTHRHIKKKSRLRLPYVVLLVTYMVSLTL